MNKLIKILRIAFIIAFIVMAVFLISHIRNLTPEELSELMPDSVMLAATVLFVLFCMKSVVFIIPMILLYICAGLIMPPVVAVVFTVFCVTVEMTIGFFAGRKLGSDRVKTIADGNKYAGNLFGKINDNVFISSFLLRIIPVFSLDVISMIFGAANADYLEFIAGSVLGVIPGLVPAVLAGKSITEPLSAEFLVPFSVFAVLSVSCTAIYFIKNKKKKTVVTNKRDFR